MELTKHEFEKFEVLSDDVLIEIGGFLQNTVKLGSSELVVVSDVKDYTIHGDEGYMAELAKAMKKSNYKDKNLMKEWVRTVSAAQSERNGYTENKAKNATRRGVIRKVGKKTNEFGNFDYRCKFTATEGEEVYFDAFYTREYFENALEPVFRRTRLSAEVVDGDFGDAGAVPFCIDGEEAMHFAVKSNAFDDFCSIGFEGASEIMEFDSRNP